MILTVNASDFTNNPFSGKVVMTPLWKFNTGANSIIVADKLWQSFQNGQAAFTGVASGAYTLSFVPDNYYGSQITPVTIQVGATDANAKDLITSSIQVDNTLVGYTKAQANALFYLNSNPSGFGQGSGSGGNVNTGQLTGAFYPLKTNPSQYISTTGTVQVTGQSVNITGNLVQISGGVSGIHVLSPLIVNNGVNLQVNTIKNTNGSNLNTLDVLNGNWLVNAIPVAAFTSQTLNDTNNLVAVNWEARNLYDVNEYQSLDWNGRYLYDTTDEVSIDYGNRYLQKGDIEVSTVILDWQNCYLYGNGGTPTVDWFNAFLYDNSNALAVNWNSRTLTTSIASTTTVDWENTMLYDTLDSNNISINWTNRELFDTSASIALSYASRSLNGDWSTDSVFVITGYNALTTADAPAFVKKTDNVVYTTGNQTISGTKTFANESFFNQGVLVAYLGNSVIDSNDQWLFDASGQLSVDWNNRLLGSGSTNYALDWGHRKLNDASGNVSADWQNRNLVGTWNLTSGSPAIRITAANSFATPQSGAVEFVNSGLYITNISGQRVPIVSISNVASPGGSYTVDWTQSNSFQYSLTGNTTFTFTGTTNGTSVVMSVINTGIYTASWPTGLGSPRLPLGVSGVKWQSGITPTQSVSGKTDVYTFVNVNNIIYGSVLQGY